MAWEEESIESGADFSESGGKKNKLKMIIIGIVVLAILGAAGWFLKDMFKGDDKPEEKATAEGEAKPEGEAEGEAKPEEGDPAEAAPAGEEGGELSGHRVNLQKFTINLSGSGTTHYLVTTIVLEVSTAELKASFDDEGDKDLAMIKTRDIINRLLMTKTYDEIRDPASSAEIGKEIKFKLNRVLKKGSVSNVYFSDFLVD